MPNNQDPEKGWTKSNDRPKAPIERPVEGQHYAKPLYSPRESEKSQQESQRYANLVAGVPKPGTDTKDNKVSSDIDIIYQKNASEDGTPMDRPKSSSSMRSDNRTK
jgi:hypothetical protein